MRRHDLACSEIPAGCAPTSRRLRTQPVGCTRWPRPQAIRDGTQHRWLLPQTGYANQIERIVYFGLGGAGAVSELRVDWQSGRRDVHRDVEADRYYVVEEGGAMRPERRPFVAP